jgi:hypothetical protein
MSFFDRNIDAIERAAHIVFWGSLVVVIATHFTGPVNLFSLVVLAVAGVAKIILGEVAETQARWDREAAEHGELWHERLRANRARETPHRGPQRPDR